MPYAVVSDLHCHKWSLFSKVNADGVNNRLRIILDELVRTAKELQKAGGTTLVIAGDIFHTRGNIEPGVLNPVQAVFRQIMEMGISIIIIPGNHDLAGKETSALESAVETLAETFSVEGSITVVNEPRTIPLGQQFLAFVPWHSNYEALMVEAKELADKLSAADRAKTDLVIHAGIDGVLATTPDHGLTAARLQTLGFRNVFAGHYHNHKDLGGGIFSIGATTHQTWGDVGSKAGFLIVRDDGQVEFHWSEAPEFVDLTGESEDDMKIQSAGNYVRYRGAASPEQVAELRKFFEDHGALGVSIQVPKVAVAARNGVTTTSGKTLDESVTGFVDNTPDIPAHIDRLAVKQECVDIMTASKAVYEEA